MSSDLRADLVSKLAGRTCVIGIGDSRWGDDGLGVELAQSLEDAGCPNVVLAGSTPESWIDWIRKGGFENVLLLDATDFPGEPGSVVFLESAQLESRYPQVSTHKLTLGTLARLIEDQAPTRVWCLGVKPASLAAGSGLSAPVRTTLGLLKELLLEVLIEK
ncbi:MAG: hydrogenase maturation protease [Acidobacteriota bacterium]